MGTPTLQQGQTLQQEGTEPRSLARLSSLALPLSFCLLVSVLAVKSWGFYRELGAKPPGVRATEAVRLLGETVESNRGSMVFGEGQNGLQILFVMNVSDCPVCVEEIERLDALHAARGPIRVAALFPFATGDELRQTAENFQLEMPIIADPEGKIVQRLRPPSTPWKIVYELESRRILFEQSANYTAKEYESLADKLLRAAH